MRTMRHKTKKVLINGQLEDIDIKMVLYIVSLNRLGLKTLFCCEGDMNNNAHIMFLGDGAFKFLTALSNCSHYKNYDQSDNRMFEASIWTQSKSYLRTNLDILNLKTLSKYWSFIIRELKKMKLNRHKIETITYTYEMSGEEYNKIYKFLENSKKKCPDTDCLAGGFCNRPEHAYNKELMEILNMFNNYKT